MSASFSFLSPPAILQAEQLLFELVQDTLRGPSLAATGFYDPPKVTRPLDELPTLDAARRGQMDAALMVILSTCLLQERFALS
jgi:asparagine synthase (glutamine-hydrolysing)